MQLITVDGHAPRIDASAWVAPGAVIAGRVTIGRESGVWYTTVVRADTETVTVGEGSNLQDGTVVHADRASRRSSATASASGTAPSCTAAPSRRGA